MRYQEELKSYTRKGELRLNVLMKMLSGIKKMPDKSNFLRWFRDWYELYRLTSHWKELRKMVSGMCERCNVWPTEEIHHLSYKNLGKETQEDIIGLCSSCHRAIHKGKAVSFYEEIIGGGYSDPKGKL